MNINDLGEMLDKPPITAPKPITVKVRMPAVCPMCWHYHPADVPCKPGEMRDNGPITDHRNADPWTW